MNTNDLNQPKRRWMRFSLRTLLLLVLFVSIGLTWLKIKMNQARQRRAVVEAIEKAGGAVNYDYFAGRGPSDSSVPHWAREFFGDDFFFDVVAADSYHQSTFDDNAAAYLKELTKLKVIELYGTQLTDAGFAHLEGLTNVEMLLLTDEQITDAGLAHFRRLTKLKLLVLTGTQVTGAGLKHLEGLTNLEGLSLKDTKVSDAGLPHLAALTKLNGLDLSGTQVTDAGVTTLQAALPNCKIIH